MVERGFTQEEGRDFEDTYSPMVKINTVRTILSLAMSFKWELKQLDVKNAFFNSHLQKIVYIKQPIGFIDSKRPKDVCLLHKAIYGLK